jgi:ABC-2 type transport system ATP-binding protein
MVNSVIVVEDLTKKYGSFTALSGLSLKIEKNSCVGFLGPNGAGKTTTMKILTGLIRPTSGSAYIEDINIEKDPRLALSSVGAIVETPEFYSYLSPQEILSYFGQIRGIPKKNLTEKIDSVLKVVRLEQWATKKISKFSKGMKQRLALASSLIHDPSILILDEPTSGLDPRGAVEIKEIIKSLKKSGKTIFLSSHILSEVNEVCDEVALVDKGKLIRNVKISDYNQEKNSIIEIKILKPITESQLSIIQKLDMINSVNQVGNSILHVSMKGNLEKRVELLSKLQELEFQIISFKPVGNELESLYMDNISESVI